MIEQTRQQGFGLREPGYWQPPFDFAPEMGALAVPILSNTGLHGSISLLWMAGSVQQDDVITSDALKELRGAAAKIGAALDRADVAAPQI